MDCNDDQVFCESMDGGAGRNIISSEDKPILRIYIPISLRTNICPFHAGRSPV